MKLEEVLFKYFNYKSFRYPQKEIIEQILNKKDTLTIIPTGFGKSLIYQIPGLILDGLTLVVTPLISLMVDQVRELKERGIKACYINSNLDNFYIKEIYKNIDKYKFIFVSAERLENEMFLKYIKNISLLVIDEAHTIKWGEDFRKSLYHIKDFLNKLSKRPVLACLTATLSKKDIDLIIEKSGLIEPYITNVLPIKENLKYKFYFNFKEYRLNRLLRKRKKMIIYILTRYKTEKLYYYYKDKIECYMYHGGLTKEEKNKFYNEFKDSKNGIMFATSSFGLGINLILHDIVLYDIPINLADLIQQAGRAGRDGKKSTCYILFSTDSIETGLKFIYGSSNQKEKIKDLNKVVDFCYAKDKTKFISEYFKIK